MNAPVGPFPDLRRNLSVILHAPASWAWALALIVIQIVVESVGDDAFPSWLYGNFGLSRDGILAGKIWQLFSHGMLHGTWWHAVLNALLVLLVGSRIEHVAGPATMVKCTVFGILAGGLSHLVLGAGLLVGLSGGCFALLLLLTTLSPQSRMFPLPLSGRSLGGGLVLAALLLALMNPAAGIPGFSAAGQQMVKHGMGSWFEIGHACHFGGAVAGWIHGRWILRPRVTLDRLRRDRARRESR
jgi:membrane associated rhomboid family serine protease